MPKISPRFVCTSLSLMALTACSGSGSVSDTTGIVADTNDAATLVMACTGCHSDQNGAIASLDPYSEDLLRETMNRFRTEADGTTVMHRIARGYSEAEIELISTQLAKRGDTP